MFHRRFLTLRYSLLKGKNKPGRKKNIENQQNTELIRVLRDVHIPFLETSLQTKHNQCGQLMSAILRCRDDTIARKTTVLSMKDEQLKQLQKDKEQLRAKVNELQNVIQEREMQLLVFSSILIYDYMNRPVFNVYVI